MEDILKDYFDKLNENEMAYKAELLTLNKKRASITSKEYELLATPIQNKVDQIIAQIDDMNKALQLYSDLILIFTDSEANPTNSGQNININDILKQLENLGCQISRVEKNNPFSYFQIAPAPAQYRPEVTLKDGPILPWYN
jgi:hypothetical protein